MPAMPLRYCRRTATRSSSLPAGPKRSSYSGLTSTCVPEGVSATSKLTTARRNGRLESVISIR
jgi:hypothetical protein